MIDIVVRGWRIVIGLNNEQRRWAIHRERLFSALLVWPLLIAVTRNPGAIRMWHAKRRRKRDARSHA